VITSNFALTEGVANTLFVLPQHLKARSLLEAFFPFMHSVEDTGKVQVIAFW
jgi:hypothetical protein